MLMITLVVIGVVLARTKTASGKANTSLTPYDISAVYQPMLSWVLHANEDCEDCKDSHCRKMLPDTTSTLPALPVAQRVFAETAAKEHAQSFVAYLQAIDDQAMEDTGANVFPEDLRCIDFFLEHRGIPRKVQLHATSTAQDSGRSAESVFASKDKALDT